MSKPYRLAVKAIILDGQNRCLLIRRSPANRNFVGRWEWPGGKLDDGEEFAAALVREAKEEAGIDVQITGLGGVIMYEMPAAHVVLLCMEARHVGGDIHLSKEHDDFAWVPVQELSGRDLPEQVKSFMLDYAKRKARAQHA